MSEMLVSFKNPEEILNFVNTVAKYPYDMDMKRGRFVVDAKSILGIMNLGLNNVISLQVYGDHCEELKKEISPLRCLTAALLNMMLDENLTPNSPN